MISFFFQSFCNNLVIYVSLPMVNCDAVSYIVKLVSVYECRIVQSSSVNIDQTYGKI